jgi:flagellar biosynthetic protein FliR
VTPLLDTGLDVFGQAALVGFVAFLRIGAAIALLPGFGAAMVPVRVKLALALAFTAVVAPAASAAVAPRTGTAEALLTCLATETLIGLSLGLVLRLTVLSLEIAGTIAAQSTSLSQMFGAGGEPMPAISHLLVMAGLALAMMAGFHVRIAGIFILSYDALPPGIFPGAGIVRIWSIGHIAHAFAIAFGLAAPFVLASTIYNVALGAINRAMPQLMVSFVGAPALTLGALVLLMIAVPPALTLWLGALDTLLADPFGAAR